MEGARAIDHPRILVAHDLALYAESLASILPELRPELRAHHLGPVELEMLVQALPGAIVICGRLTSVVHRHAAGWILLHPEQENILVVGRKGWSYRVEEPQLADVLDAVDGLLARMRLATPVHGTLQDPHGDLHASGDAVEAPGFW